jgi:hypothetical protein
MAVAQLNDMPSKDKLANGGLEAHLHLMNDQLKEQRQVINQKDNILRQTD